MEQKTLTVVEAAARLRISRNTAYRYAAEGVIPTIRIGRRVLVPVAQLDRMLDPGLPTGPVPAEPMPAPAGLAAVPASEARGPRPSQRV